MWLGLLAWIVVAPALAAAEEVHIDADLDAHARGFLGVDLVEITPALRQHFGAPKESGVMIGAVEDASPAARAGLKVADIVTAVDGHPVDDPEDLRSEVRSHKKGDKLPLELWRDHKKLQVAVEVAERDVEELDLGPMLRKLPRGSFRIKGDASRAIRRAMERMKEAQGNLPKIEDEVEKKMKEMDRKLEQMEKQLKQLESHHDGA
jgi:membrane-associated protease RseP (regulator of RpoE activity)